MTTLLQRTLYREILKNSKYGADDAFTTGRHDGLSYALHRLIDEDGSNLAGCPLYDPPKGRDGR
ncbi:hypothetical protein [Bifidobacterium vansinderenii]|uniref:Uncharacterized protein n=1 Tax=Bifidobacterium vansinderenii TaxID=1984871 RepID=A0A229W0U4_9BIFI|nr:hypothetical protein [Bifidobacterium vansinderenii]OXN01465.1 hypothetical protein Tam10B_0468 [Bifidobacterium vansinderenii]